MAFGFQARDSNGNVTARYDDAVYSPVFMTDIYLPERSSPSWIQLAGSTGFYYLVIPTPENYNTSSYIVLVNKFNMVGMTAFPLDLQGMRVNAWLKDNEIWLYVTCDDIGGFNYIKRTCRVTVCKV